MNEATLPAVAGQVERPVRPAAEARKRMSADEDPVVGHKTYRDENGTRHEPLRQSEAEALMASIDAAKQRRAELMPTEQDAARAMWEAYHRLEELGWRNATYCPRDGRTLLFIEAGSSGIHEGHCDDQDRAHRRPTVWLHDAGDLWPSQPVLYREPPNAELSGARHFARPLE